MQQQRIKLSFKYAFVRKSAHCNKQCETLKFRIYLGTNSGFSVESNMLN